MIESGLYMHQVVLSHLPSVFVLHAARARIAKREEASTVVITSGISVCQQNEVRKLEDVSANRDRGTVRASPLTPNVCLICAISSRSTRAAN
jgi:hypothetical protein